MSDGIGSCPIWGQRYVASRYFMPATRTWVVEDSTRAGGGYVIGQIALSTVRELDESQRAMLTTMLINQRSLGVDRPKVTPEMVEDAKRCRPLPVYERAERLLQCLAERTPAVGSRVPVSHRDVDRWLVMAWTESTNMDEAMFYISYLEENGWIELRGSGAIVKVEGFSRVADQATNADSSQAFVAMWFDDETDVAYEGGIKPAIEEAGYEPVRIDREPDVDKIDDAIIANIRKSRFLVADFTHGKKGARGGVYYEAGFAHGLNIPVIFTCRRDMVDELHFDTRQYVHILWDAHSLEILHTELLDRITARIGEGPELGRIE